MGTSMSTSSSHSGSSHSGSSRDRVTGTPFTRGLGILVLVGMALLIILGLFVSPADVNQGESVRIMYAHVPGGGWRILRSSSPLFRQRPICGIAPVRSPGTVSLVHRPKLVCCLWASRSSLAVCGDALRGAPIGHGTLASQRQHSCL